VIFFRVDEYGYLVDIRGNGLKRMGVNDLDWVGRPGYGLFIGMDEKIDSALSGNTVFFENRGTYNGTPWWFYTSMFFDSWSGYGAVGFSVDITEQKYVEEQLVELLNNNRKLAQSLVEVEEDERRALARELHDELGQSITAVRSLATVITASADKNDNEITSLASSIIDLSGQLYDVVNNIMQRLRPDIIDSLDFSESIRNCIVRSQLETAGVNCTLDYSGNINNLEDILKVTIYRIVQECLTNISKHAMASNVSIKIHRGTDEGNYIGNKLIDPVSAGHSNIRQGNRDIVQIEISDDGIGMDVEEKMTSGKQAKRHGLQGINERVTAMGGMLEISASPGRGVKVQVVLVLGSSNHNVSHDIHNFITDLREMRPKRAEFKKIQTH
jgi:glucose-6-phosphate-specific signal transduction histidine kinase